MPKKKPITDQQFLDAFANRLKSLRLQNTDMSAEAFALEIGLSRSLYYGYEKAKGNITAKNMTKIFNGLGVTPEEFFGEGFGS